MFSFQNGKIFGHNFLNIFYFLFVFYESGNFPKSEIVFQTIFDDFGVVYFPVFPDGFCAVEFTDDQVFFQVFFKFWNFLISEFWDEGAWVKFILELNNVRLFAASHKSRINIKRTFQIWQLLSKLCVNIVRILIFHISLNYVFPIDFIAIVEYFDFFCILLHKFFR